MFYVREVVGWVLMVLGLWLFYQSCVFVINRNWVGSGPTVLMGIVVFRGGIHLLKVAVAARVCQQAPIEARPSGGRTPSIRPQRRATVVPGRRS
jgi:hypothetical protein